MNKFLRFLPVALLALMASAVSAQQLPVLTVNMTEIDVNGVPAFGANQDPPTGAPTDSGQQLNGGNAAYTDQLTLWALATGTSPVGGFTYTFFVNGLEIGIATPTPAFQHNYGLSWRPPQPGVYFFSVVASDGAHTAQSPAVQFYATGIDIVSPLPNTDVPLGSSVVIQAATSLALGAVSRVNFYSDSVLLGSSRTYPYSIIYTPPGPAGTVHFISAKSYEQDGTTVAFTAPAQGLLMVAPVGPLPVCTISTPNGTPASPTTIAIPDYVADASAYIPVIVNAAAPQGNIQQVQLYINGTLFGTVANYPYAFKWQPAVTGTYDITALAYDDKNNVVASTTGAPGSLTPAPTTVIVGSLPSVAITSPADGATISGGGTGTTTVTASANDTNTDVNGNPVQISQVQFFQDNDAVGVATSPTVPGGDLYSVTFTPTQKFDATTGDLLPSTITAIATDALGFSGNAAPITVKINLGGSTTSPVIGTPPTISITAPVAGGSVIVNSPVTLAATAQAMNTPGNVTKVEFLVDNSVVSTITAYPYTFSWTPTNLGTYTISAQVTDNVGNVTNSKGISVNVVTEPPPTIKITSPQIGSIAAVSTGITITANAASPHGTVASVQFFENGIPIGTVTQPPYTETFTPLSAGVYTLTAITTDNAGETTTSAPVVVEALPATSGLGTTAYFGQYQGLTEGGRFAFIVVDGTSGTYIGHSSPGATASTSFYSGIPVSAGGNFSTSNLNGVASASGVNGTLSPSQDLFIGAATQSGGQAVASGYFSGSILGQPGSQVTAIVGNDGEFMAYLSSGTYADVADGSVDSSGAFTITTVDNDTFTGKVDPITGFLTGTLSGSSGGSVAAAKVSGGTFSDGALINISTRGQVGSGSSAMITGFVVAGGTKQLLVRAAGPALTAFGLSGAVGGTQLEVFSGSNMIASNTGWDSTSANATQVTAADSATGAFALQAGSADSALVSSFAPGAYTVNVSGLNGATGTGLVEIYDMDGYTPFSAKKLVNVSTRASVGTGTNVMIGGFSIDGTAPKRLLIRGAGPSLTAMGVTNSLAAVHLLLYNNSQVVIRENYSWGTGNDPTLLAAAEQATGAFAFATGSSDAAILVVLPPGTYTAEVASANASTGVGLVEVYEVP